MASTFSAAVQVCDGEKSYGTKSGVVLAFTKLNLKVPLGNIYGLLGPSGCGKTTLLRCILGRLKLDKGSVFVFGHCPSSKGSGIPGPAVGYMAQETTVYTTMTIDEYFRYFGTILGLSSNEMQSKSEYFINLLNLPPKNTLVTKLSGGQIRCVQFAAACIHDPKVMILDEPTVGIDIILKNRMWDLLVKLVRNNGVSVILTTHYIEEARLADKVGMIHGGTMAAEDTVENLLTKYNEITLEAVFLKICYQESTNSVIDQGQQSNVGNEMAVEMPKHCQDMTTLENAEENSTLGLDGCDGANLQNVTSSKNYNFSVKWHRLWPVMWRSVLSFYRFPGALVLIVLLPVIQILISVQIMAKQISGIQMVIINNDLGQMGALYLSYLNQNTIIQKHYSNYDDGFQALKNGEAHGILHIKPNFSEVVHNRFTDFALKNAEEIKAGTIDIRMDNTNLNIIKLAEFHLLRMYQHFLFETLDLAGFNPALGNFPINISDETINLLSQSPIIYVLSGQLAITSLFSTVPMAVLNIFLDKRKGYLETSLIAGVTPLEIMLGLVLGQLAILVLQVCGSILAAPVLFGSVNKGSLLLIVCLMYVQGFCGATLAILVSLLSDTFVILFAIIIGIVYLSGAVTGAFWPVEAMPAVFQYICQCFPATLSVRAFLMIINRGWNLYNFAVMSAFGITFMWIFIFFVVSLLLFYINE